MNRFFKIVCSCIFTMSMLPTYATEMEQKEITSQEYTKPFADHALLLFLDNDHEKEIDFVSNQFFTAFIQKAAPILVSTNIARLVFTHPNLEQLASSNSKYEIIKKRFDTINTLLKQGKSNAEIQKELAAQNSPTLIAQFNEAWDNTARFATILSSTTLPFNDWIIKRINGCLLLLIPKDYKPAFRATYPIDASKKPYTEQELTLGLKIENKKTIETENIHEYLKSVSLPCTNMNTFFILPLAANTIFITRKEYQAVGISHYQQPRWIIYLTGHGEPLRTIASLPLDTFKSKFLPFLPTINTRILIYSSCYASGINSQVLYNEPHASIQKTYPFAIAALSLTEAPTTRSMPHISLRRDLLEQDLQHKKLQAHFFQDFPQFIKNCTTTDTIQFDTALKPIAHHVLLSEAAQPIINYIQLKLPGIEWFNVIESHTAVASIGARLAASYGAQRPLSIATFFKKQKKAANPRALLLYAQLIPFEIQIDTDSCPLFVSMVQGDTVLHKIYKLSTTKFDFKTVLYALSHIDYGRNTIFWIQEFETKDVHAIKNLIIDIKGATTTRTEPLTMYYTKGTNHYMRTLTHAPAKMVISEPKLVTEHYMDTYNTIANSDERIKIEQERQHAIKAIQEVYNKRKS